MFIIDSHCHLNCLKEENAENIDNVVLDAYNNDVKIINNICTDIAEFDNILALTNKYDNVFCSIGHHPEYAEKLVTIEDFFQKDIENKKIIGIGECGLDYHFTKDFIREQRKNFEVQIEIARKTQLPLIIHTRDADLDTIDVLKSEMKNGEFKFLLHCFSSGEALAYTGLDLGGYISFSGILTFKNALELQKLATNIPLDRILVETDSPYLAPVPLRGQINKPAYTKYILEFLANLLKKDVAEIIITTTNNCFKLFNYKTNLILN